MFWIGGDGAQRLRRRPEQDVVDHCLVLERDNLDHRREEFLTASRARAYARAGNGRSPGIQAAGSLSDSHTAQARPSAGSVSVIVARLEQANLWGAQLKGAFLLVARLAQANLRKRASRGADLRGAHLEGSWMRRNSRGLPHRRACLEGGLPGVRAAGEPTSAAQRACPRNSSATPTAPSRRSFPRG